MYAIGNIIYGVPASPELQEWVCESDTNLEEMGFDVLYSGSGDFMPAYVGISLGTIDECGDESLDDPSGVLNRQPTPEQVAEVHNQVAMALKDLPPDVADELPPIGRYIAWSTS